MRTFPYQRLAAWLLLALMVPAAYAQLIEDRTKLAQTGMQFLTVPLHARAAAMGDAMTAQGGTSASLFYNPAGMALMTERAEFALGQTQWIGDIDYSFGSAAFRPAGGRFGTIGVSVVAIRYGELFETIRADNTQGFEDLGTFSPSAFAAGLGYARSLTDRFSVGGQIKYVRQSLGASTMSAEGGDLVMQDNNVGTLAVDFGVLFQTGFRSLNFAVSARNFSQELAYEEENFELPLSFRIGVSANVMDLAGWEATTHSVLLTVDAEHPRDYVEQVRAGAEYQFMNTLALRVGYVTPTDEEGVSLGAGIQQALSGIGFGFDYAYTRFGAFGNVHRLALEIGLQ